MTRFLRKFVVASFSFFVLATFISVGSVFALTYSQDVGVSFTFGPMLRVIVSSDLFINNLAPGTTSDSNIIEVRVLTNNSTGYSLNATVGNNTAYNTRNLVHETNNSAYFSSINYGSSLASLTTDSTWGYSYSTTSSSSGWSNYSGLPLYSDSSNVTTLKTSNTPPASENGDSVWFKIAAKAAPSQASGVYHNVINFTAVANVVPQYTVQFNANTGTGSMPNQTIFRDQATMLSANLFAPPAGKVFAGWNTAANGSGTSYTDQQSVTNLAANGGSITLYAQWVQPTPLYDLVAAMTKGTQTAANLRTNIVTPSSSATVSSNSGVYEYDASVFGTASDASNTYPIYYYRGILDSYGNTGTYGSDGLADAYPNYVKLANNTCWRIIRTTGSGGVKMIFGGVWSNNSCAKSDINATADFGVWYNRGSSYSSDNYGTNGFIVYAGYNYNSTYAYENTQYTSAIANSTLFSNGTASNVKTKVESWYANNMTAYTSILETSAGYCNDRSKSGNSTIPYSTSVNIYFGADDRLEDDEPSLNCPNVTGHDLLSTSNGLTYPVALITADEAVFAGSGGGDGSLVYHEKSYLNSGHKYWTISPDWSNNGVLKIDYIGEDGGLDYRNGVVSNTLGVRPVISLVHGAMVVSGTGTATNPWVINAP